MTNDLQNMNLGEFMCFCKDFKIPIRHVRIQEIYKKNTTISRELNFSCFLTMLQKLADEICEAKIEDLNIEIRKLELEKKKEKTIQKILEKEKEDEERHQKMLEELNLNNKQSSQHGSQNDIQQNICNNENSENSENNENQAKSRHNNEKIMNSQKNENLSDNENSEKNEESEEKSEKNGEDTDNLETPKANHNEIKKIIDLPKEETKNEKEEKIEKREYEFVPLKKLEKMVEKEAPKPIVILKKAKVIIHHSNLVKGASQILKLPETKQLDTDYLPFIPKGVPVTPRTIKKAQIQSLIEKLKKISEKERLKNFYDYLEIEDQVKYRKKLIGLIIPFNTKDKSTRIPMDDFPRPLPLPKKSKLEIQKKINLIHKERIQRKKEKEKLDHEKYEKSRKVLKQIYEVQLKQKLSSLENQEIPQKITPEQLILQKYKQSRLSILAPSPSIPVINSQINLPKNKSSIKSPIGEQKLSWNLIMQNNELPAEYMMGDQFENTEDQEILKKVVSNPVNSVKSTKMEMYKHNVNMAKNPNKYEIMKSGGLKPINSLRNLDMKELIEYFLMKENTFKIGMKMIRIMRNLDINL